MKLKPQAALESLTAPQRDKLRLFDGLLQTAAGMGLVSDRDASRTWDRHVLDSIRGLPCLDRSVEQVVDLGSGAGLPGVPLAVGRPDTRFTLVEPRRRAAAFLELAVESLELPNVSVLVGRAEHLSLDADLCLARAVATPAKTWTLARSVLRPGGRLLLWAGRSWSPEAAKLDEAVLRWKICSPAVFSWQGPLVIMAGT